MWRDLQLPDRRAPGPSNYVKLLSQCGLMQGFNTLDEWGRFDEAFEKLRGWVDSGQLTYRGHEFEGLDGRSRP